MGLCYKVLAHPFSSDFFALRDFRLQKSKKKSKSY